MVCGFIESLKYLNRFFTPVQEFFFLLVGIISWVKAFLRLGNSGNIRRYVLTYKHRLSSVIGNLEFSAFREGFEYFEIFSS